MSISDDWLKKAEEAEKKAHIYGHWARCAEIMAFILIITLILLSGCSSEQRFPFVSCMSGHDDCYLT